MASSITLTSKTHNSRYFKLECTQKSNGSAENSSTITWKLSAIGDDTWYSTGPTKVIINGTTVYSKDRVSWEYGKFPVAQGSTSGTLTVPHGNDGTKKITVKFSTAIYTSTVTEYSDTWTLDSIPRYGTCNHSLNSKTETTVKMNWSSDSTVDYLWYSKDNGSNWTGVNVTDGKSGTYTISGLSANATYKIKTRIRRKDSQLTTDSAALIVTTYDYPYCTSSPDFALGNPVTLTFYNPLSRAFDFYIIGNGTQIDVTYHCETTEYKGVNSTETSVPMLYATIPNAQEGKYKVKVVYGSSTRTRDNGNKYKINASNCTPSFSSFEYYDDNIAVTLITENDQILVKGLSSLNVRIPSANKMTTKLSATPKEYVATVDTLRKVIPYNGTGVAEEHVGTITSSGTKRLTVTAYDSRGLYKPAYKDITVYDYEKPTINASAKRLNNFEDQTTITITGTYSRLTINGTEKNAIQSVRYRLRETGGTWGNPIEVAATVTVANANKCNFTCQDVILPLDNTKSFEIEVLVLDSFSQSTKPLTVDIGQAILLISSNKRTAYLNGKEITTRNNVRELVNYTQLAEGTDLNTILTAGTYRSVQASHTATMENTPSGLNGGFTMYVYSWSGNQNSTEHRRQELVYAQHTYIRRTLDGGATWSAWTNIALINSMFPVGYVVCRSTNTNPNATYGGTWELIDKEFKAVYLQEYADLFTPAANVVNGNAYFYTAGHAIHIRQKITVNTAMTDTGMALGKFNFAKCGANNIVISKYESTTFRDGANGGIVWNLSYDGTLEQVDVVNVSSIPSGTVFYIDFETNLHYSAMIDSYCDRFYFKRTT